MVDKNGVIRAVSNMVDAVNHGDFTSAGNAFTQTAVIIEDIPPFRWQGRDAVSHWLSAMGSNAATLGISSVAMSLGEETRLELDGREAYAVFAGQLCLKGASVYLVADGTLTFTLRAQNERWLIDTLVWSGPEPG